MDPSLSSLRAPWAGQCACAPLDCPQWADGCKGCECGAQAAMADPLPMRPMQLEQMQPARPRVRCIFSRRRVLQSLPLCDWKMNLLAASPDGRTLLVGSAGEILVLPLSAAGVPRVIESTVPLGPRDCGPEEDDAEPAEEGRDEDAGAAPEHAAAAAQAEPASPSRRRPRAPSPPPPPPPHNEDVSTLYAALSVPPEPADAASARRNPLRSVNTPAEVNAMRVGWIGNHPVLIVATMGGHSCCFDLDRVASLRFGLGGGGPACLHATATAGVPAGEADLVRLNQRPQWQDNSAWSVSSTPQGCAQPIVLVGSNACRAFIWRVGREDGTDAQAQPECKTDASGAATAAEPSTAAASSASAAVPFSRSHASSEAVTTFIPAGHNVPSVDISSCGGFAALACIDAVVRVARLDPGPNQGEVVATGTVDDEWGWTVRFVPASVARQVGCTYVQMQRHRAHAPLPDELLVLRPSARPAMHGAAAGAAHPMLAQMVEQLMLQVAADMNPAAAAAMRADLRRQLEHLLRQQMQEPPEEEEEEEEGEDELDAAADEDEDEDEDAMADDAEGDASDDDDDDDQPPELADSDADDADADDVAHHEMGWEAGFEPHRPELGEEDAGGDRAAAAEVEDEDGRDSDNDSYSVGSFALSADSIPSPLRARSPLGARARTPMAAAAPRPTDLLIYTSKSHVYLLDGSLRMLARVRHVCLPTLTIHRALHRTLFVECIPALGIILLASSASDRVLLYRPVQFTCGRYTLEVQGALPQQSCGVPIKGVSVCRVPGDLHRSQAASLQHEVRRMASAAAAASAAAPSDSSLPHASAPPPPALVTRSSDCWRVHVLYADEHMAAFELSLPRSQHAFDIANLFD